jgi:choline monooxygenase
MTSLLATRSLLPAAAYGCQSWHDRELAGVFRRSWVCVAMRDQLANANDFVVRDVGGLSLVVQNTGGVIRAFHNVCSHRHSAIQDGPCGNRSLVCPYHGWTYDAAGLPVGVPANKEGFGLSHEDRLALRLDEFPIEWCGPFAFTRLAADGPDLRTHLGEAAVWLEELDALDAAAFVRKRDTWQCNWKLGLEISLEGYHADFVHADTLRPLFGREATIDCKDAHSVMVSRYLPEVAVWWESTIRRARLRPLRNDDSYRHAFIFPNLVIGVTCGCLLSVQTYWPLTPLTSVVDFAEYLSTGDERSAAVDAIRRGLNDQFMELNERILGEDRSAAERVQRVVAQATRPAVFGTMESRLASFQARLCQTSA